MTEFTDAYTSHPASVSNMPLRLTTGHVYHAILQGRARKRLAVNAMLTSKNHSRCDYDLNENKKTHSVSLFRYMYMKGICNNACRIIYAKCKCKGKIDMGHDNKTCSSNEHQLNPYLSYAILFLILLTVLSILMWLLDYGITSPCRSQ